MTVQSDWSQRHYLIWGQCSVGATQRDQIKPWAGGAVTTALTQALLKGPFVCSRPWQLECQGEHRGKAGLGRLPGSVVTQGQKAAIPEVQ